MPFELPLFPLNVVLFPAMPLPLHIFEPRYRLMMKRCLEAGSGFGVALIISGQEGHAGTVPATVGCSAEIVEAVGLPDGRLNLQAQGRRRFRIIATRELDGYLVGTAAWLDDKPAPEDLVSRRDRVTAALEKYLRRLAHSSQLPDLSLQELDVPEDPYAFSMWVGALVDLPHSQKQALLQTTSTAERLDLEHAYLQRHEIVQCAFDRREQTQPGMSDEGAFDRFMSLN